MKFLFITFLIFCFLGMMLPAVVVHAEEIITWQQSINEAKDHHPDLISAGEDIRQSEADKTSAVSGAFPQIDAGAAASDSETDESYSYGVSASQLIFDGNKTIHQVKAARQNIIVSQFEYMVVSSDVRLRLRRAFIGLLRQQELLQITQDIAARRQDSLEQVRLRYEAGREHKGSLLTAEANLAQAEADLRQAERNIGLSQRSLIKELGRRMSSALNVNGDFNVFDMVKDQPDFESLADTTPMLKELAARKEASRRGVSSARADYWPAVYADADIGRSDDSWAPRDEDWSAGIRVTLPLFDGLDRHAALKKAKSVFRKSEADELSGRDQVILTLHETWAGLQDAVDNVDVQKKFLESAETRAKISQAQYANGLTSFDDWIIIEDALVRTKKSFLDAQANAALAEAEWIQAKGGTLENEN